MDARGPVPNLPADPKGEFPMGAPEYALYLLYQAERLRHLSLEPALEPLGITLAQWRALAVIRRMETCAMTVVSRLSGIDRTTLTRAVDQLVADGLVERQSAPRDRRQVILALTRKGLKTYERAVAALVERSAADTADIPDRDLRTACRVLRAMVGNMAETESLAQEIVGFARRES
jgi:DNA-binding MarR family transcriptional regulator